METSFHPTRRQFLAGIAGVATAGAMTLWNPNQAGALERPTTRFAPSNSQRVLLPKDRLNIFTQEEVAIHRASVDQISSVARQYLERTYQHHTDFFSTYNISKYFGNRNPNYQTRRGRIDDILRLGGYTEAEASFIADQQEPTACILLAMQALSAGFEETGTSSTWKKIRDQLAIDNKFLGTDLQIMLQKLGWSVSYWNPKPRLNTRWDEEDIRINPLEPGKTWNPVWGGHAIRYTNVRTKKDDQGRGIYDLYAAGVDDYETLVDFQFQEPAALASAPFFVGIAHVGYHVFPGYAGKIIESHSIRQLNDPTNMEVSMFNPLKSGGGPRWTDHEKYRSGLIVTPYAI